MTQNLRSNMEQMNERYFPEEEKITRHGFITHMEKYMKQLLTEPLEARPDEYLQKYGIDYKKAQEMLLKPTDKDDPESSVMRKEKKIITGYDGKDKFQVKYLLPRKDYRKKMKRLFIKNFEKNIISELNLNEDGEGSVSGGATACNVLGDSPVAPITQKPLRKRTLYVTEAQVQKLREATAGDIGQGYVVPFSVSKDDPSMDHNNIIRKSIQK